MVMTFQIRRRGGAPLGDSKEVIERLSYVFPDASFNLVTEEPTGEARIGKDIPIQIRLLQKLFLPPPVGYPQYRGFSNSGIEFCFAAGNQVKRIETTCWGIDKSRDANFDRLIEETGWVLKRR
jgi:hypothetical protein